MNEEDVRWTAMQSRFSCDARRLFAHLPDDVVDSLCNPQAPPHYGQLNGHVALSTKTACYVLTGDGVLGVRGLPDGSDEIVTYRDRGVVHKTIRPADVVERSDT